MGAISGSTKERSGPKRNSPGATKKAVLRGAGTPAVGCDPGRRVSRGAADPGDGARKKAVLVWSGEMIFVLLGSCLEEEEEEEKRFSPRPFKEVGPKRAESKSSECMIPRRLEGIAGTKLCDADSVFPGLQMGIFYRGKTFDEQCISSTQQDDRSFSRRELSLAARTPRPLVYVH